MGYVHDTHTSIYIPPTFMLPYGAEWTEDRGTVPGTIAKCRAADPVTSQLYIPITAFSNTSSNKGSLLKSIEVDYENKISPCVSVTLTLTKITRGVEGAPNVVSAIPISVNLSGANSVTVQKHKIIGTVTTPAYILNTEYYIAVLEIAGDLTGTTYVHCAVANITFRA